MALNRLEAEVNSAEETELASLLSKTLTQMWAGAYWSEHTQALHNKTITQKTIPAFKKLYNAKKIHDGQLTRSVNNNQ